MKFGVICALLLLFALPAKADSGTVTVNVTGTADFNANGYVLDGSFSYDVTGIDAATFFPTASSMVTNITFSSTGNLGLFTLSNFSTSDVSWINSNGFIFDTEIDGGFNPAGNFLDIELFVPVGPNPGPAIPTSESWKFTEVPEPSALALLLVGMLGMAALKLRRA